MIKDSDIVSVWTGIHDNFHVNTTDDTLWIQQGDEWVKLTTTGTEEFDKIIKLTPLNKSSSGSYPKHTYEGSEFIIGYDDVGMTQQLYDIIKPIKRRVRFNRLNKQIVFASAEDLAYVLLSLT